MQKKVGDVGLPADVVIALVGDHRGIPNGDRLNILLTPRLSLGLARTTASDGGGSVNLFQGRG